MLPSWVRRAQSDLTMNVDTGLVPRKRRSSHTISEPPAGFRYWPDFITEARAAKLMAEAEALTFAPFHMRGVDAKREVVHFGASYGFDDGELASAPPLPPFLVDLFADINQAVQFAPAGAAIAALVTRYRPGAGIGWHRDAPPFGAAVVGLSLGAPCEFRLRLEIARGYDVYRCTLAPCSLYLLAGAARFRWQHAIPPVASSRYSITFRTLRTAAVK